MSTRFVKLLMVLALAVGALSPVAASAEAQGNYTVPQSEINPLKASGSGVFIVVLADRPLAAYEGGTAGLAATSPSVGTKLDPNSSAAQAYASYLRGTHRAALDGAGARDVEPFYTYTAALNGFAARLTSAQANALDAQDNVLAVFPEFVKHITTDSSPDFIGLNEPGSAWSQGFFGEDVIVGVIDTGIWPEHPSFADDGSYSTLGEADGWFGEGCDFGNTEYNEDDAPFECNDKLLAAKSYGEGFHGGVGDGLAEGSYNSARDEDGHGTHTTSTAAGNAGVSASILGADYGTISGIAPRARVSMYKACWSETPTVGGCNGSDLVAAIDSAVIDGVDVINYSIGSPSASFGADDISFLFANDAGVFVATSAGNEGPGAATVGSPIMPWMTLVGASTQTRDFQGTVTLGDATVITGVTVTGGTGSLPLVDSEDLDNELCDPDGSFSGDITGKIVLCRRGVFARVAKSQAVFESGGAGMILYNPTLQTLNTDNHYVPSLHVDHNDGPTIKAYIDSAGAAATATLSGGMKVDGQGSVMASFSSRGPNRLAPDIIVPDVTAPGVNILAGNTPTALLGAPGELFQAISGTSMASPHVAGAFALLKEAHPDWYPSWAKSALMTTARQDVTKENGLNRADPFDMGAGHIDMSRGSGSNPTNPGMVYHADFFDYLAFLCAALPEVISPDDCAFLSGLGYPVDEPSDFNHPSIGVADLVGSQTVTRYVTNPTESRVTFLSRWQAPAGYNMEVSPRSITLDPFETGAYEVTITNRRARLGAWRFGYVEWTSRRSIGGERPTLYTPVGVRAAEFAAPAEVFGFDTSGSDEYGVQFGYNGAFEADAHTLIPATEMEGTVDDDPTNDINGALASCDFSSFPYECTGLSWHAVEIDPGSLHARFATMDGYTSSFDDDLDLYVWGPDGGFVGGSGSPTSQEQVDVPNPQPGIYEVAVHGWQTAGPSTDYVLFSWDVGGFNANLSVDDAPPFATLGGSGTVAISWGDLDTGNHYLGAIEHGNGSRTLGVTLVNVNTVILD